MKSAHLVEFNHGHRKITCRIGSQSGHVPGILRAYWNSGIFQLVQSRIMPDISHAILCRIAGRIEELGHPRNQGAIRSTSSFLQPWVTTIRHEMAICRPFGQVSCNSTHQPMSRDRNSVCCRLTGTVPRCFTSFLYSAYVIYNYAFFPF